MEQFYKVIGYNFKNSRILEEALTHPSMNSSSKEKFNYERLEFLGDSVLSLIITEYLVNNYSEEPEGSLAKRRAALICGGNLATIAREISLGDYLIMAQSESQVGGRENDRCLEDAMEALIGAIYKDSGYLEAKNFILKFWSSKFDKMIAPPVDPKSLLQEWAQKDGKPIPEYEVTSAKGPSHCPTFSVKVSVEGAGFVEASGTSKRKAERAAAEKILQKIREIEKNG